MKYIDPNGEWVLSLGISGNVTCGGGWGLSIGIAFGYSEKDGISLGSYATGVETQGTPSAGIGITGTYIHNAESGVSVTFGKGMPIPEGHGSTTGTVTASISDAEMAPKMAEVKQAIVNWFVDKITNPYDF